jgi:hypothetical protein
VRTLRCGIPGGLLVIAVLFVAVAARDPRLRAAEPDLFSSYDVLVLRVEAPFDDLFAGAKEDADYSVEGTLAAAGNKPARVRIALRGHTSRRGTECTFPKLKLAALDEAPLPGGGKTLKLGTHCGEAADGTLTARFGRLPNERSPWREAAVYRLLDALRVPALRARPARVTYAFTQSGQQGEARTIERNAMVLEDDDDALVRLGAQKAIEADAFTTAAAMFEASDSAMLAFAEALIGNFDWCVKFTADDVYRCDARLKLWNVIAAARPGGKALPVMYDFDVSGMVAGSHRWFPNVYNASFVPSKSEREVEVIAQVQRTRSLFPRAELDAARRRFTARKADAYRALDGASLDDAGRRQIREYMDAFYREIESDRAFYRPVVATPGAMLKAASAPSSPPICGSRAGIPVGTPVSDPLETRDGMVKVTVLDALWHWAPPAKCPAVQRGVAWIDQKAIGTNYPAK